MSQPSEVRADTRADRLHTEPAEPQAGRLGAAGQARAALAVLGVVYGDLGTSAIYALHAVFGGGGGPLAPTAVNVLGVVSLVFWTLIVVVSLKYMAFVLRADNGGEGGTFALIALLRPWRHIERPGRRALVLLGLAGAAMLYAGIMITPAISILSAMEGLEIASPAMARWVVPATAAILVALFALQRLGTARIGAAFGPIMALWFAAIAALGVYGIVQAPQVLAAVNPMHALALFRAEGWTAFTILFAVFLVTTGAEAMYADIGHFGRRPIRQAWFFFVLPALLLNYFGQGAMLLHASAAVAQPFFHLGPSWLLLPLVALATLATVIASQATISGAFSMTRQAGRLGMLPRSQVVQTSPETAGQIYVPLVNWVLMVAAIVLVVLFQSSGRLASTYGISVSTAMVVTTVLAFFVARERGHWPLPAALLFLAVFLPVDLAYFGSNLLQIPHGGWFPVLVGGAIFVVMSTWRRGGELLASETDKSARPLAELQQQLESEQVARVPGSAIFLTLRREDTPPALAHHIERNHALQQQVVLLTVLGEDVPRTTGEERLELSDLGAGFYRVVLRYGYLQQPNVPSALAGCKAQGLKLDLHQATYYVERLSPISRGGRRRGMAVWRDRLLGVLMRNSADRTSGYQIPSDQVVELGLRVRI